MTGVPCTVHTQHVRFHFVLIANSIPIALLTLQRTLWNTYKSPKTHNTANGFNEHPTDKSIEQAQDNSCGSPSKTTQVTLNYEMHPNAFKQKSKTETLAANGRPKTHNRNKTTSGYKKCERHGPKQSPVSISVVGCLDDRSVGRPEMDECPTVNPRSDTMTQTSKTDWMLLVAQRPPVCICVPGSCGDDQIRFDCKPVLTLAD